MRVTSTGRIDDPNGRLEGPRHVVELLDTTPWHQEGGKGSRPKVVKFQMRPESSREIGLHRIGIGEGDIDGARGAFMARVPVARSPGAHIVRASRGDHPP